MKTYGRLLITQVALACLCFLTLSPQLTAQGEPKDPDQQQPAQSTPEQTVNQPAPVDNAVQPVALTDSMDQTGTAEDETQELLKGRLGPNYVIGPEDVIELTVFDVPDLQKINVQVADDGTIQVPLLGSVKAAGLSQRQLRDELADLWGKKYLQNPQVSVFIKDFKSRPVSVIGSVAKPGVYYLTARRTLIEVLAMAGGLARTGAAAGKVLYVERPGGFRDLPEADGITQTAPDKIELDLKKLIYSQDSKLNIEVRPFDIITVSRADIIYVTGAVKKPGGFVLEDKESVSVLEAMAMAQGFDINAAPSRAKIIRRSPSGALTEVPVDLSKVLQGHSTDTMLAANDILFVPSSAAKATGRTTLTSVVSVLSGLLIYGRL
jgi:polysaccharide biosynthesis/export protein